MVTTIKMGMQSHVLETVPHVLITQLNAPHAKISISMDMIVYQPVHLQRSLSIKHAYSAFRLV